jgi:PIN domain nuclease of toxin-antitoxin system
LPFVQRLRVQTIGAPAGLIRDPFDCMLIAAATLEDVLFVSHQKHSDGHDVRRLGHHG